MFKLSYRTNVALVATVFSISPSLQARDVDDVASFNCNKAKTQVEKMICESSDLSNVDGRLGKVYSQLQKLLSKAGVDQLKEEQREWLKNRDAYLLEVCQGDVDCAVRFYEDRVAELETKESLSTTSPETAGDKKVYGVVTTESTDLNIRQGMGTDTAIVGKVKKGARLRILETLGPWYKVQLEDGKTGYASSEFVKMEVQENSGSSVPPSEEESSLEESPADSSVPPSEEESLSIDSEESPANSERRPARSRRGAGAPPLEDGEAP